LADVMPADMDSVNLDSEEWISDINNATNVLKMCLREVPYPLLISGLHQGLMDAASKHFMLPISHERQKLRTIACGTYVYTSVPTTCQMQITLHSSIFGGICTSVCALVTADVYISV